MRYYRSRSKQAKTIELIVLLVLPKRGKDGQGMRGGERWPEGAKNFWPKGLTNRATCAILLESTDLNENESSDRSERRKRKRGEHCFCGAVTRQGQRAKNSLSETLDNLPEMCDTTSADD